MGAGFAGMTCAVALAMRHNCVVSVFDREKILLKNFRQAGFRFIHPELNSRGGWGNIDEGINTRGTTEYPFLNWSANFAPSVAEEVCNKFDQYRRFANIALHLEEDVLGLEAKDKKVILTTSSKTALGSQKLIVDIVLIATGFGKEKGSNNTNDVSYWHSGNPESYRPIRRRNEKILISGNGDSGIMELAHFLVTNFDHSELFAFLPGGKSKLGTPRSFAGLKYKEITEAYHGALLDLPGPVVWYFGVRETRRRGERVRYSTVIKRVATQIYNVIDNYLSSYQPHDVIPNDLMRKIRQDVSPLWDDAASYEIAAFMRRLTHNSIFHSARTRRHIEGRLHGKFAITVAGKTPTIYSAKQAPQTWFLLRLLELLGSEQFEYRVESDAPSKRRGRTAKQNFDRIVVRRGPDYKALTALANPVVDRWGLVLLDNPTYWYRWLVDPWTPFSSELCSYFRTERWKRLFLSSAPLRDANADDKQELLDAEPISRFGDRADVDKLFLDACGVTDNREALRLYRSLKARPPGPTRNELINKLDILGP